MSSVNMTFPVPYGTTDHGDVGILCTPPRLTDFIWFYFGNYFSHAATIMTLPGQNNLSIFYSIIWALAAPTAGLARGLRVIFRGPSLTRSPLKRAHKANALVMVVRESDVLENHSNRAGDVELQATPSTGSSRSCTRQGNESQEPKYLPLPPRRRLHGTAILPPGYSIVIVPQSFDVRLPPPSDMRPYKAPLPTELASSFSFPKFVVSFIQLCYSISTLYHTGKAQVEQFGFYAFSLTVTPYAFMSIINTIAHICSPEYPCFYLVSSPTMDEARNEGGVFDGVIGSIDLSHRRSGLLRTEEQTLSNKLQTTYLPLISLLFSLVPLAFIGIVSRLRSQHATGVEVSFISLWYSNGILNGIPWIPEQKMHTRAARLHSCGLFAVAVVPAVGGMVVVGKMFKQYGSCISISS